MKSLISKHIIIHFILPLLLRWKANQRSAAIGSIRHHFQSWGYNLDHLTDDEIEDRLREVGKVAKDSLASITQAAAIMRGLASGRVEIIQRSREIDRSISQRRALQGGCR